MLTASPVPVTRASTGRGRQLRWKVAMPEAKAPKADAAATTGEASHSVTPTMTATPAAPRRATSGSSLARSGRSPARAARPTARNQLMIQRIGPKGPGKRSARSVPASPEEDLPS